MRIRHLIFYALLVVGLLLPTQSFASPGSGVIDSANRISWLCKPENGNADCHDHTLVNWKINPPVAGADAVTVHDSGLTGWIWSAELGWIHLAPTSGTWGSPTDANSKGVTNTTSGILGSYAWAISGSWVNFNPTTAASASSPDSLGNVINHGVQINPGTGYFSGWAWVQNYGWMLFDCATPSDPNSPCVSTDWRPVSGGSTINPPSATPDPSTGPFATSTTVTMSSDFGTTIHYLINPSSSITPDCSSPTYSGSIVVATSEIIKAVACDTTNSASPLASFNYVINIPLITPIIVGDPVAYHPAGTYSATTTVVLSSASSTNIYYNIGPTGSVIDPDCTSLLESEFLSTSPPIVVSTSESIKAIGCNGIYQSNISTFDYIIAIPIIVSDPVAYHPAGTYSATTTVTLTSTNATNIFYTNNGDDPVCPAGAFGGYGTVYSVPLIVSSSETIKAIGCNGIYQSNISTFNYTINVTTPPEISAPESSLPSGTYTGTQTIFLTSLNSTSIHYLINPDVGVDPTCSTGSVAIPINVATSETIKAIGCTSSAFSTVSTFSYEISSSNDNNNNDGGSGTGTSTATTTTIGLDFTKVDTSTTFITIATTSSQVINAVIDVANVGITNTSRAIKKSAIAVQKVFSSPANVAKIQAVTTTGVVAGTAVTAASGIFFSSFSLADLLLIPIRLWSLLLGALGLAKRKKPWGTVYDSITKQPLDPAYVVLKSVEGADVATAITDLDGRYGFVVPQPGNYSLFVHKTNYVFPSQKLVGQDHDELYRDLYFGEHFAITESGEFVAKNIPMDPEKFDWNEFAKKSQHLMKFYSNREKWFSRISNLFFGVGFAVSTLALMFSVTKSNIIIFVMYVVLFFIRKFGLRSRPFGSIISKDTNKPVAFAIIRISQAATGVEIMHRVTDAIGRYYCLLPNGNYNVRIDQKLADGTYKTIAERISVVVTKGYLSEKFIIESVAIHEIPSVPVVAENGIHS